MKYAVIGRQIHTMPYAIEVGDMTAAMGVGDNRPSFVPMFVIDFDSRTVKRLARDGEGVVQVIDEAFNESIGRHTTTEQMQEIAE